MKCLAPHREFRNPGDCSGLPEVHVHRPVEPRAKPLPGVKHLRCPTGISQGLFRGTLDYGRPMFPRLAWVLGRLSLLIAVVFMAALWVSTVGSVWWPKAPPVVWAREIAVFSPIGFFSVPGLTLAAQASANWQDRPSGIAMLILYVGGVFLFMISLEFMLAREMFDWVRQWLGW